jgi:hypothetical protein
MLYILRNSCRIRNLFFLLSFTAFFPLFRSSHTGNCPHEDVARFGYRPGRSIKNLIMLLFGDQSEQEL